MATNSQFQGLKDALNNSIKSLRKWHGRANSTAPAYFICLGKLFFYFTTLMLRLTSHCESLTQISRTCTFGMNGTASGMLPAWSSLKMWWVLQSHASSIYWHYCLVWQVFHCTHSKYDDGRWECPRCYIFPFALLHADTSDCLLPFFPHPFTRLLDFYDLILLTWSHLVASCPVRYASSVAMRSPMYDIYLRATHTTTSSIGGVQIPIYLVSKATDSL